MNFLDISEHNNIIDYSQFTYSNLCGVILKATEGTTFIDKSLEIKYHNLNGRVKLGFYHMLTVLSAPETQAQNFWNNIKDKSFDIIPVIDVEYENLASKAEEYTERFINKFQELSGFKCLIYSGLYYCKDNFSYNFRASHNWWLASYGTSKTPSVSGVNLVAWQFTENCKDYNFINGEVDCSYLYQDKCFYIGENNQQQTITSKYSIIQRLQHEVNIQGFGNLVEDGLVGWRTLQALPLVRYGAMGNITRILQELLRVSIDGIFGNDTFHAVKKIQQKYRLSADGIVGYDTWNVILSEV